MRILAIDTSSRCGSVALLVGDEVVVEVRTATEGTHASHLLECIDLVLRVGALTVADLDALACVSGPGSFTGLRVGISTIQGLALGGRRACVAIPALEALAAAARGTAPHLVALIDGFRSDVFAQRFDGETGKPLNDPASMTPREAAAAATGTGGLVAFVGSGASRYRCELADACPEAVFPAGPRFLAPTAARLAVRGVSEGRVVMAEGLRPLYIRPPDLRPSRG